MIQTLLHVASASLLGALTLSGPASAPAASPQDAGDPPIPTCVGEEIALDSGVRYCVLAKGEGTESPRLGDKVKVDYTGWLTSGKSFDSSRKPRRPGLAAEPANFWVGGVIEGWNQALVRMVPGDHWRVYIPSALAYGERGSGRNIGPNEDLIFEVELLEITERMPAFVAWDDDAEGIVAKENGLSYRVLEPGTGPSIEEAGQGKVTFSTYSLGGEIAFAHTLAGVPDGVSLMPENLPVPLFKDVLGVLRKGSRVQVRVPGTLGVSARQPLDAIPSGEDELWIIEGLAVRPVFRMPTADELITTESGLQYTVLSEGEGEPPTLSDRVSVDYVGWYTDGESFDASFNRGRPAQFGVGGVIKGWTEGLQLMKPGTEVILVIPAPLAYGSTPPGGIRKDADLVFYVKLLEVLGR
ncbi:MAG: FKBP-type peptidyl-prolyl cis-trans isomerase [Planctomycetota bacterium]